MATLIAIIVLGFFLGMRHATDPDHVIAVTTIVSRQRTVRHAALIGMLWGLGHTCTVVLVGAAIILFSVVIPARVGLTMELSVGLMLILLGVFNLTGIMRWITETFTAPGGFESRPHNRGDFAHSHPHGHNSQTDEQDETPLERLDRAFGRIGLYQVLRPLIVGLVHGLAGSAAVALLVVPAIRNPFWAVSYLLVFGVGTIAGMMLITAAIALPFAYTQNRFARVNQYLGLASGFLSLGFGLFLVYEIGFVQGLFSNHPHWVPH